MNRREFIQKTAGLLSTLTLFSSTLQTRASSLEERIMWEGAQRRIGSTNLLNYAFFSQYAPPREEFPPLFVAAVPNVALFFPYKMNGKDVWYPVGGLLFIIMPPGYAGERVETSPFPQGRQESPVPLGSIPWSSDVMLPLQPVPNIFNQWDGVFVRKGVFKGEEYLFAMDRQNLPTFIIRKEEDKVRLSFFEFDTKGKNERGEIAVYRNGRKDASLSGIIGGTGEKKEHVHIRQLVSGAYVYSDRDVYPLYEGGSSLYAVELTIPLSKRKEPITIAYTPRIDKRLPEREEEVHLEDTVKKKAREKWYSTVIPLLIHLNPDRLKEQTYLPLPIRPVMYKNEEADRHWAEEWLSPALRALGLPHERAREIHDISRVVAYPRRTEKEGIIVRAADEPYHLLR